MNGSNLRLATVLAAVLGGGAAGQVCLQPSDNCQSPDQMGHGTSMAVGVSSDDNPAVALAAQDNFVLGATTLIDSVCWWGLYVDFATPGDCAPGGVPDVFTITYYDNVPGVPGGPGALKAGPFDVTATLQKAATGNLVSSAVGTLAEYQFTATHPDVQVIAGDCTWIEIRNDTSGSDPVCRWLWSTAPSAGEGGTGDSLAWQSGVQYDLDLAFCVNAVLGDPSSCSLAPNSSCAVQPGPGEGACFHLDPFFLTQTCTVTDQATCDGLEGGSYAGDGTLCQAGCNVVNSDGTGADDVPDVPGCLDAECCTIVCDPDFGGLPDCCLDISFGGTGWDQDCVTAAASLCGQCGSPGSGNCFAASFTPYCDNKCFGQDCPGCCTTVCDFDPVCCDPENPIGWDGFCAFEAQQLCPCDPQDVPPNDDCADAIEIGLGDTPLDNHCATADGPQHALPCADNPDGLSGLGLDVWYTYQAGYTGDLLVSTCDQADYDTQLAVYEGCGCGALSDPPLACNNNGALCAATGTSLLVAPVVDGNCYLIRVGSGYLKSVGTGTLTLSAQVPTPCEINASIPPQAVPEPEPCGDDVNGGCGNQGAPTFTSVAVGDVVHGTAWASGGTRDTDWYEIVLAAPTEVSLIVEAEFPFLAGFAATAPPGSGDCADHGGSITPSVTGAACTEEVVTAQLAAGTWWPFVAPTVFDGLPCAGGQSPGNDYVLEVALGPPCPADCDGSGDGLVGVDDFLAVLAQWGQTGTACDMELGAAGVGVDEFLAVLSAWGACP